MLLLVRHYNNLKRGCKHGNPAVLETYNVKITEGKYVTVKYSSVHVHIIYLLDSIASVLPQVLEVVCKQKLHSIACTGFIY